MATQPARAHQTVTDPTEPREIQQSFRPRARVLRLLGDELIGSPRLAVFELVKNGHDADANQVRVRMDVPPGYERSITVTGDGMTEEILKTVWLVSGDDYREKQRKAKRRSEKHHLRSMVGQLKPNDSSPSGPLRSVSSTQRRQHNGRVIKHCGVTRDLSAD